MSKTACLTFLLLSFTTSIADVNYPDKLLIENQELTLAGKGVLSRWFIKGCHMALYVTPGIKQDPGESKPLDSGMASRHRSLTMRINYLAQDRADVQFAGKELARRMSSPTEADWQKLKRVGRYLVGRPRMVLKYNFQKYTAPCVSPLVPLM